MEVVADLSGASLELRQSVEGRARGAFANQLAKDRSLLAALADFVGGLEDDGEEPDVQPMMDKFGAKKPVAT